MGFADNYLKKQFYAAAQQPTAFPGRKYIVVIPCIREPNVLLSLESLKKSAEFSNLAVEVVVVINSSENAANEIKEMNKSTHQNIELYKQQLIHPEFRITSFIYDNLPAKKAGVGLARKLGMDYAVKCFNQDNNPDGVIISYDADTLSNPDFIKEIDNFYKNNPKVDATTVYFEHRLNEAIEEEGHREAMILYELYLRYYILACRYTGFPYAFHTIGSCFNVKAITYIREGGMNQRQGGEDFYFLHKIIPDSNFAEINATCIYPSPRVSNRVPFGTGSVLRKILNDKNGLPTYHPEAFFTLRAFFLRLDAFFDASPEKIADLLVGIPKEVKEYLILNNFYERLNEIRDNTSNLPAFQKRFFNWFNAFRILKYLNYYHSNSNKKIHVTEAASMLLENLSLSDRVNDNSPEGLLRYYRSLDKTGFSENILKKVR